MSRPKPLPTYQQIAKKASVSTKTVCNVFRYPELVREKTAARVINALRLMGISDPSVIKRKLRPPRPHQGKTLLLLESTPGGAMSTPVYSKIMIAAETRAHELGWQLAMRHKNPDEDLSQALRNFRGEGILLFGGSTSYEELSVVLPSIAAVRVLAAPPRGHDCDNVDYDRGEVPRLAAQYLADRGCKRVVFLGTGLDIRGPGFVHHASNLGMKALDISDECLLANNCGVQIVNRAHLVQAWKKAAEYEPDGIFGQSDQVTNALYSLLGEYRIKPQQDIQIVSCNAEELFLGPLHPRPATIDIHTAEIGRRAVDLLIARLQNPAMPPSTVVMRPKLIPGE